MQESIQQTEALFPGLPVKMSAQCYLITFYESFGFKTIGEEYLEDGIPHIAMVK
jgi:ElaA protein